MVSHIYTLTGSNLEFPLKYENNDVFTTFQQISAENIHIKILTFLSPLIVKNNFDLGICFKKDNSVMLTCAGMTSALQPAILTPA